MEDIFGPHFDSHLTGQVLGVEGEQQRNCCKGWKGSFSSSSEQIFGEETRQGTHGTIVRFMRWRGEWPSSTFSANLCIQVVMAKRNSFSLLSDQ
jgi:hypothetical protein